MAAHGSCRVEISACHQEVSTQSKAIKTHGKRMYNRRRRRKNIIACHGCKKTYKTKTWLFKHKTKCQRMKMLIDKASRNTSNVELSPSVQSNNTLSLYTWNVEGYESTISHTSHDLSTIDVLILTETFAVNDISHLWTAYGSIARLLNYRNFSGAKTGKEMERYVHLQK